VVRSDLSGEYLNNKLKNVYAARGMMHETTAPYTPEQNGKAERLNQTITERARATLQEANLPTNRWAEPIATANYIRFRSPTSGEAKIPVKDIWSHGVCAHSEDPASKVDSVSKKNKAFYHRSRRPGAQARLDMAQAVEAMSRYMSKPNSKNWLGDLKYLAGTVERGIIYGPSESELEGYCDADYAGDIDTRRSTTGYIIILNGGIITWSSRLQATVAVSTAQAEYMAAPQAVKEALWLCKLIANIGIPLKTIQMHTDGCLTKQRLHSRVFRILKNPIASARSRSLHIDIVYHFARESVARQENSRTAPLLS